MASDSTQASRRGSTLIALMILVVFLPLATNAADADGDGIEDSLDDCPWAYGTSTIDRDGCPDRRFSYLRIVGIILPTINYQAIELNA